MAVYRGNQNLRHSAEQRGSPMCTNKLANSSFQMVLWDGESLGDWVEKVPGCDEAALVLRNLWRVFETDGCL